MGQEPAAHAARALRDRVPTLDLVATAPGHAFWEILFERLRNEAAKPTPDPVDHQSGNHWSWRCHVLQEDDVAATRLRGLSAS